MKKNFSQTCLSGLCHVLCLFAFSAAALAREPVLVQVPAGSVTLGAGEPGQASSKQVEVPAFAITATEITVGDYRDFVNATGHQTPSGCFDWLADGFADDPDALWDDPISAPGANHPVVCVRWTDASAYARWLSAKTGDVWRLPSETEWEYAAKAGRELSQPLTPETACKAANLHDLVGAEKGPKLSPLPCSDGYAKTAPVGTRVANGFGLYDTLGNVSEWTASCWLTASDGADPESQCSRRVVRGGAWKDDLIQASTTSRVGLFEEFRSRYFGFRLVRGPASAR